MQSDLAESRSFLSIDISFSLFYAVRLAFRVCASDLSSLAHICEIPGANRQIRYIWACSYTIFPVLASSIRLFFSRISFSFCNAIMRQICRSLIFRLDFDNIRSNDYRFGLIRNICWRISRSRVRVIPEIGAFESYWGFLPSHKHLIISGFFLHLFDKFLLDCAILWGKNLKLPLILPEIHIYLFTFFLD